ALLDLRMPGIDGLELFRQLRAIRPATVAIIVTAYAGAEAAAAAVHEGVRQVLPKPVDLSFLLSLIDRAVKRPLILLVDDDAELCKSLTDLLHSRGYRVACLQSGQDLESKMAGHDFHLALIDLKLPSKD